jgi:hypothetical protein
VPLSGQSLDPEAQLAKVLQPAMTLETEVPVGSVHRWQRRMAALLFLDLIPDRLDSAPFRSFNNLPNVNLLFALSIRLPLERKHWCSKGSRSMAKRRVAVGGTMTGSALSALDDMEPELRHLAGLITALRILGEADDCIEPVAISSLARCGRETVEELERNWRMAIGALRER